MEERQRSRKRREESEEQKLPKAVIAAAAGAVLVLGAAGFYIYKSFTYRDTFLPGTYVNGQAVAGKTVQEAEELINAGVREYQLTLELKDGDTETVSGAEIGLYTVFDGSLDQVVEQQNPYAWPERLFKDVEYTMDTMVSYDEQKLNDILNGFDCFDEELTDAPVDASISEYQTGTGYSIVPESEGNRLKETEAKAAVGEAVKNLQTVLSFEEAGLYEEPAVRADNETLRQVLDTMNRYVGTKVTYRFGDRTSTLDGERIKDWLSVSESQVSLDQEAVAAYVEELAAEYDTDHNAKTLKTSYGQTIKVTGGSYGWRINQSKETEELTAIIQSGETVEREPVYSQKAASRGENDYGDTYVEINLTAQHLFYYVDGKLLVESDFVSGNLAKGYGTPAGSYSITYTQRDATLRGEDYATPVKYWMPFNGGIGLHDANWRSSFGGVIYKTGGSHGCVNLPPSVAKTIFENIQAGVPVLCYNLEGTEQKSSSADKAAAEKAAAEAAAAQAAAEAAAQQAAAEKAAAEAAAQAAAQQAAQPTAAASPEPAGSGAAGPTPGGTAPEEPAPTPASTEQAGSAGPTPAGPDSGGAQGPGYESTENSGEKGPGVS